MYIGYDIKNGVKYAKICKSYREGGKVKTKQVSLGRVVDEKAGIYRNRKRGVFTYDLKTDTYGFHRHSPKICSTISMPLL